MHVRPGYRENLVDLQGTLKLHMQFYNRISRLQRPSAMKIGMHIILCVHAVWLQTVLLGEYTSFACANLYYHATLIFFNNICRTLMCVYTYNEMYEKL